MKGMFVIIQNVKKEKLKEIKKFFLISIFGFSIGTISGILIPSSKSIFEKILQGMMYMSLWIIFTICVHTIVLTILYFREKRKWNNGVCKECGRLYTKIFPWTSHVCNCGTFYHIYTWDAEAWDKDK